MQDFMQSQIEEKLAKGFDCIKLKIGVDWKSEKGIIKKLREKFPKEQLELRVDANGAFSYEEARMVLQELADLGIHSIEQPIKKSEVRKSKSPKKIMKKIQWIAVFPGMKWLNYVQKHLLLLL